MNIPDIDYQKDLEHNHRISGGLGVSDRDNESFRRSFYSPTGEIIGNFNASSDVKANGTNQADVSLFTDFNSNTVNKVSLSYGTSSSAFAATPGI